MNTHKIKIKEALLSECRQLIQEKIDVMEKLMNDAQQSANNETKSSAGDKFETGRAMMHQERDQHARQLSEALQLRNKLQLIKPDIQPSKIAIGSVVITKLANYFIAISAGRIKAEGKTFYVISPQAPLAQELLRKEAGDTIIFNDQEVEVLEVF